jgi:hypothetical protein
MRFCLNVKKTKGSREEIPREPSQAQAKAQSNEFDVSALNKKTAMYQDFDVVRLHRYPTTRSPRTRVSRHAGLLTPSTQVPMSSTLRLLYKTSDICQASWQCWQQAVLNSAMTSRNLAQSLKPK